MVTFPCVTAAKATIPRRNCGRLVANVAASRELVTNARRSCEEPRTRLRRTHRAIPHAAERSVEIYINAWCVYVNQATSTEAILRSNTLTVASDDFRARSRTENT